MKFQQVLTLLLATLVVADDDAEKSSGLLRGIAIRDSDPSLDVPKREDGDTDFDSSLVDDAQRHRILQWFQIFRTRAPTSAPVPDIPDANVNEAMDPPVTEDPVTLTPPIRPELPPISNWFSNPRTQVPSSDIPVPDIPDVTVNEVIDPPVTEDPVTVDPVTVDPVTVDPVTVDPVTVDPVTEDPATPTPPIRQETRDINGNMCGMSTSGTVILHGGIFNYEDPLSDSLGQTIVREMRTNSDNRLLDPLVFVPGARRDVSDEDEQAFENQWQNIMAPGVPFSVLHSDDQEPEFTNVADAAQADSEGFVRPLKNAMGVFLPGGRQWRLIDAYKYTQTEEELWNVLNRGGVIAGTSAGAAVMGSFMPRGDPSGSSVMVAEREWYQHGFGFVSNIALDNHVGERGRELAMYDVLNDNPENRKLLGIGLNENTMIVVKGRSFQVLGDRGVNSIVRVYDCSQISQDENCNFQNAPYVELTEGNWYDLCARRQIYRVTWNDEVVEDGAIRSVSTAYKAPWSFKNDFKSGNPNAFLCSGRRCTFTSNPIVLDSQGGFFSRVSGTVYKQGSAFNDSDKLVVRYRSGNDQIWKTIFDSSFSTAIGLYGKNILNAIPVPPGKSTIHIEIEAQTIVEGDAEFQVRNLMIQ